MTTRSIHKPCVHGEFHMKSIPCTLLLMVNIVLNSPRSIFKFIHRQTRVASLKTKTAHGLGVKRHSKKIGHLCVHLRKPQESFVPLYPSKLILSTDGSVSEETAVSIRNNVGLFISRFSIDALTGILA